MEAEVTGPNTIEATLGITAGPFEGHRIRTFMHAPFYGLAEAAGDELETGPSARYLVGQRFHAHLDDRIPAIIPETVKLTGPARA